MSDLPKKNPTMMGKLLSRVHNARYWSHQQVVDELWKRNGLENPTLRKGWVMKESKEVHRDGTEVREYKLYKLMDAAVVTISAEVNSEAKLGLEALRENQDG